MRFMPVVPIIYEKLATILVLIPRLQKLYPPQATLQVIAETTQNTYVQFVLFAIANNLNLLKLLEYDMIYDII